MAGVTVVPRGELRPGEAVSVPAWSPVLLRSAWSGPVWLDAERVAVDALAAVRRGEVICTPSMRYRSASAALRLAPRWLVRRVAGPATSARAHF